ncbi:HlyD family type I secretion periplasmic adaptor subunit [Thiomicrorhabdus sediminis]|uniref:Membrane fusion protein (MFP) family protein n=2 Tax=Thiomicrorhabdus sediminis TaxID=2580412 RepID=A0A4P9K7Q2_9GAMM|nr:HlyD family type I secretion periplasmic adaptor subunit [Thiomicrorhabdus sediminis]
MIKNAIINNELQHKDWVIDAEWAKIQQQPIRAKSLLYLVALIIVGLITWAAFAPLDEIVRGQGKVIPSNKLQVIQSLDGGSIKKILVTEGQKVKAGDLLVQIDATRSESSLYENEAQVLALRAEIIRLQALTNETALIFPQKLINIAPDVVEREQRLYRANMNELQENRKVLHSQLQQKEQMLREARASRNQYALNIELLSKELDAVRPLLKSGAVSEVEIFKMTRELNSLQGELDVTRATINRNKAAIDEAMNKISELKARSIAKWREQLSESSAKLASLQQTAVGLEHMVQQTDIRSPINGTVQRLLANTVSGVVTPGQTLMEILPTDDILIIEAKINPRDIAFLLPGQPATIKFSAYDFTIYGGVEAEVTQISPDSITDEKGNTYYIVKLKTRVADVHEAIKVIPGMIAEADIITGKKTVLEYLFKPILRASSQAMTER